LNQVFDVRVNGVGGLNRTLSDSSGKSLFEGVVVTRFDMLLGPTPAVVYPEGFITGEALRGIADDAMLLLSMGIKESVCSIMSFSQINKIGIVGTEGGIHEVATGTIVIFDRKARSTVWETYPLIKSLILNELSSMRVHPGDAALRLYEGVRRVCERSHEDQVIGELGDKLEEVVDRAVLAINSLLEFGNLDRLGSVDPGTRTRIIQLLTVLEESRSRLIY
jgi:hypothetical protein